uniref:MIP18 family-like domain-containing protein n=1 Tax=Romanomermis culicivorax TaxID=13658 RepID=A0A915I170_ROMCU
MLSIELENVAPRIFTKTTERQVTSTELDPNIHDEIDGREIFDLIRDINDPEHPLTLEELNVIEEDKCQVNNKGNTVLVQFTPTIPHCSMATLIGLSIRVKLLRLLPTRFKVDIKVTPGSHQSEEAINKQLGDKERVAAALENSHLLEVVNQCLTPRD